MYRALVDIRGWLGLFCRSELSLKIHFTINIVSPFSNYEVLDNIYISENRSPLPNH